MKLFFGEPGTGKTRQAMADAPSPEEFYRFPLMNSGSFWLDGYDNHPYVLIDDFAGAASHMTLCALLQLTDRYAAQVPVKGSFVWFNPETIVITTNIHPRRWYKWEERESQYAALQRRVTETLMFVDADANPIPMGEDFWINHESY